MVAPPGPRGGMVDTRDLKSLGLIVRAGSSPAVGTRFQLNFLFKYRTARLSFQKGNSKWVKKELIGAGNALLFFCKMRWDKLCKADGKKYIG